MKSFFSKPLNVILTLGLLIAAVPLVKYLYLAPKFINGDAGPEFEATLVDGSPFHLSDLRGKYVILDFWGSWCGPCRVANDDLVRIYQKYHTSKFTDANGLEIVSIGVEKDRQNWLNAIQEDGLVWKYHTSTVQNFESPIAVQYGVKEIPTSYLLNEKGVIIGVNYNYENLDRILKARLAQ